MYLKRFQPFIVHLILWISFYIGIFSIKIDSTLLLIFLLPLSVVDLWLAFSLALMLRMPKRRTLSDIPSGWISEEKEADGYPVRWLRTSIDNSKPLVILIHGWNSRAANMTGRAQIYAELGFNVLLFEMRAHGGNKPVDHWAAMHICHDFEQMLLEYSASGWLENGFIVHGHSMGGFIAQRALRKELETSSNLIGVILESPVTSYSLINNVTCEVLRIPGALHPWMMNRLLRLYNSMNKPRYQIHDIEFLESPKWGVPDVPTLLVQAMHDATLGEAHWRHLVEVHSKMDSNFTQHIVENLKHSHERTNKERDKLILQWMEEESLLF